MGFYDEMQGMASELLGELGQGVVSLKRISRAEGPNAWTPGTETVETFALSAAVRQLHQRYENGVLIVETGDMVTFAVPEVVPVITDLLVIDGVERAVTNLTPVPAAGTPVVWKAWCAG